MYIQGRHWLDYDPVALAVLVASSARKSWKRSATRPAMGPQTGRTAVAAPSTIPSSSACIAQTENLIEVKTYRSALGKLTGSGSKRDNLLAGHSSGHRVRCAQTYRTLTTREETMIGT
jgi:hypothetical protein